MSGLQAVDLRCESQTNPVCVGTPTPRFSWSLVSTAARGVRQDAYQIRVATHASLLSGGHADLWDSGRVQSRTTTHVPYPGAPLRSAQNAWWQVGVWTSGESAASAHWSEPAMFTLGILEPKDWRASWITAELPEGSTALPLWASPRTVGAAKDSVTAVRWSAHGTTTEVHA